MDFLWQEAIGISRGHLHFPDVGGVLSQRIADHPTITLEVHVPPPRTENTGTITLATKEACLLGWISHKCHIGKCV